MPAITLHQFPPFDGVDSLSPFCTKVHRALGLKGLSYAVNNLAAPPDIKKINARGKLPVLELDGRRIPDSTDILRALDALQADPPLYPADAALRARVELMEDWSDEGLYWVGVHQRWVVRENFDRFKGPAMGFLPAAVRWFVPAMIRSSVVKQVHAQGTGRLTEPEVLERIEGLLDMLVRLLGDGPFFFGEAVSAADVAVFGLLQAVRNPITPAARDRVEAHPELVAWLRRVDEKTRTDHTAAVA